MGGVTHGISFLGKKIFHIPPTVHSVVNWGEEASLNQEEETRSGYEGGKKPGVAALFIRDRFPDAS